MRDLNKPALFFLILGMISGYTGVACGFAKSNAMYYTGEWLLVLAWVSIVVCIQLCFVNMRRQNKEFPDKYTDYKEGV
jgi:uncharacterized sodium:solute symporter family permease YidK